MPFEWTINPYRGCEFGCKYCYARYTHEFMELRETEQFETLIYAKEWSRDSFRRELARIPPGDAIAIGTATDPYQPAERRFGLTRRLLSVFAETPGRTLSVTTKSDLVARSADLLGRIAHHSVLHVFITITTVNERLARILEPFAPRPMLRLNAIRKLADAGVRVVVLACPVMPLINDSPASLAEVARMASAAGAVYMFGNVLFLKPCAQKAFFPMLEREFPQLVRRYRERYEKRAYLAGHYPEMIRERMQQIRDRYGLTQKPARYEPEEWAGDPQQMLFE
jgi:DNA repair photolyase